LSKGGTGATTAADARTALGVDAAGTDNSTDVTLATVTDNYLSINIENQVITAGQVPISLGGTGASTLSAARTSLGISDVSLASVADNYLSVSGNTITAGIVPLSLGGTGATDQAGAALAILPQNPTTNSFLKYDGSGWIATVAGNSDISGITDDNGKLNYEEIKVPTTTTIVDTTITNEPSIVSTKIKKIKLLGISGTTSQYADIREFEFGGLGGWGYGNRKSGSYQINVTTNFSTSQYPASPSVNTSDWVNGSNTFGDPNSLYLSGTQSVSNKYFLFDFIGSATLPNINELSELRIYWDRQDISSDGEEGTFDLIVIDENNVEQVLFRYTVLETNLISGTNQYYLTFNNINSHPNITPQIPQDNYQYITLTYENAHPDYTSTTDGNQRTHSINFPENVVADILVVGGGGGGDKQIGGGGGGGAVLYAKGVEITTGTYSIKVGRGGNQNENGYSSEAFGGVCLGGGSTQYVAWNNSNNGTSGGSGSGASASHGGNTGGGVGSSTIGTLLNTGSQVDLYNGKVGGIAGNQISGAVTSGGGGGAGQEGFDGTNEYNSHTTYNSWLNGGTPSKGGDGVEINITGTLYYWGGGGGGGGYSSFGASGGLGGGGAGGTSSGQGTGIGGGLAYNSGGNGSIAGGDGGAGTGGGGGGGGWPIETGFGGNGGSGIVIIRYYVVSSITHKYLALTHETPLIEQKTGVGGWRIVRYLPPNLGRWYSGNYINTTGINVPSIGTAYDYTNEWSVPFGTFDEMVFGTFDMTHWLQTTKAAVIGTYNYTDRNIIKSSAKNYAYTAKWFNRVQFYEDPWISINDMDTDGLIVFGENSFPANGDLRDAYGGMAVWVRDSTTAQPTNQTTYTLNVPENTTCDILIVGGGGAGGGNGQGGGGGGGAVIYYENIDLNGNYTIKVGKGANATNSQNIGDNGYDSLLYRTNDNLQKFVAKGGGGGGSWNSSGYNARDGGSGGGGAGGSASVNGASGLLISGNIVNDVSISISSNSYNNTGFTGNRGVDSLNDTGCFGNIGGYEPSGGDDDWGAGGGGAGTIGEPTTQGSVDIAGDGGSGKKFDITGNVSYYGGGGGGGMRPTTDFNTGSRAGYGGLGGGGNGGGGAFGTQDSSGFDGTNGTGGGGGGVGASTAANYKGGNGGSGIVIIRYSMSATTTAIVNTQGYLTYDSTDGWYVKNDYYLTTNGGSKWSLIGDTEDLYYSSNVKIGGNEEVTPVAKLEVNGDIVATGRITAGYSDDRLKDYISNITNPIDIIKSLNGYYYKPNELANSFGYTNQEKEIGVSAQEVKSVLPEIVKLAPFDSMRNIDNELVSKSGSNYLTVNYEKMAPLFIEAIKKLSDKIDRMTIELNSLKQI